LGGARTYNNIIIEKNIDFYFLLVVADDYYFIFNKKTKDNYNIINDHYGPTGG
jgi:hypothetical protein